ncbi:MAG: hypothetical protein ACQ5SW_08420 [Sphaerochaetaceae bacterium]
MKGRTIIQLFDAETEEMTDEYVEENLVTNAYSGVVETVFNNKDYPLMLYNIWKAFSLVPSSMFGGVMLLDTQQVESADNLFPLTGGVVGHANDEAHTSTVSTRGSINEAESGDISSGETYGYKWVWDFATDRANGNINCIALCQENTGERIKVDEWTPTDAGSYLLDIDGTNQSLTDDDIDLGDGEFIGDISGVGVHQQNTSGTVYVYKYDGSNTVDIGYDTAAMPTESSVTCISTVLDTDDQLAFSIIDDTIYGLFYDASELAWYLKTYDIDFTTELTSVSIDLATATPITDEMRGWSVMKGDLYQMSDDGTQMHRWDGSTGTYVESIDLPGDLDGGDGHGMSPITGDLICLTQESDVGYNDVVRMYLYNESGWFGLMTTGATDDATTVYRVRSFGNGELLIKYHGSGYHSLCINPFMLNTVNNLATTIEKTSDKTMKITYELTW